VLKESVSPRSSRWFEELDLVDPRARSRKPRRGHDRRARRTSVRAFARSAGSTTANRNVRKSSSRIARPKTRRAAHSGRIVADRLRADQEVQRFVREFDLVKKPIFSIGHGAHVLISAQIARGLN